MNTEWYKIKFSDQKKKEISIDSLADMTLARFEMETFGSSDIDWIIAKISKFEEGDIANFQNQFKGRLYRWILQVDKKNLSKGQGHDFLIESFTKPLLQANTDKIRRTYDLSLNTIDKSGIDNNYLNWSKMHFYEYLPQFNTFFFKDQNKKHIANLCYLDMSDSDGKTLRNISWIWIDSTLDMQTRKNLHEAILSEINKMNVDKLQAVIAFYNKRSLKFFYKLGFRPSCIQILNS